MLRALPINDSRDFKSWIQLGARLPSLPYVVFDTLSRSCWQIHVDTFPMSHFLLYIGREYSSYSMYRRQ